MKKDYPDPTYPVYPEELTEETSMDTNEMKKRLSAGNPFRGGLPRETYRHPSSGPTLPDPPTLGQFGGNERKYQDAYADWWAQINGLPAESTRTMPADRKTPYERLVGRVQLHATAAERDAQLVKMRAQRVRAGVATLAERKAEYQRTGRLPGGMCVPDEHATHTAIFAAHAAMIAAIEAEDASR